MVLPRVLERAYHTRCMVLEISDVLTVTGAARILGVTPETVRAYDRRGILPALRTDTGIRLFLRSEVERVAAERAARGRR